MKESNLAPTASLIVGNGFTDRREEHHPEDEPVAREGVEPTDHQGLSLAALPVCVSCRNNGRCTSSAPDGIRTHGLHLDRVASTPGCSARAFSRLAQEGFEPSASLVLSESGLPVAYRALSSSGGWNRTSGLHGQSVA
jgi:hypothetical protein